MNHVCPEARSATRDRIRVAVLAVAMSFAGPAAAQTANELSDAARNVFRAFPQATSFRTIVRDVDQRARGVVEKQLPFKVHFNELGPHALYVPFRRLKPVGLMYVRTEDGGWGFSEISWSLSLDLRVVGFRFLRARSPHRFTLQRSRFARELVGKGYKELRAMLGANGSVKLAKGAVPVGAEELAGAVVRSAMKTMLVTRCVWTRELRKLQDVALGIATFPAARGVHTQPTADEKTVPRKHVTAVRAVRAFGTARADLGVAVEAEVRYRGTPVRLRFGLSPRLRVLSVVSPRTKTVHRLQAACNELIGKRLRDGTGPLAPAARELGEILEKAKASRRKRGGNG